MTLPSTRQLEAFLHVARLGSFRRAAEVLHMSQPALSQSVVQLEQQLGTALLSRSTRAVRPTPAGQILLQRLDRIMPDLHEVVAAIRELGETASGRLRVACIPSVALHFLPPVIASYRAANPRIRILVMDGVADRLYDAVLTGSVDFALSSSAPTLPPDLHFEPAYIDRFRAVIRRDHVLAEQEVVSWTELFAFDFLGFTFGTGTRHALDLAFAASKVMHRPIMELTQMGTILGMVNAGIGVSALPNMCCPSEEHPTLCSRPLVSPEVQREIGFVTRKDVVLPGPAREFRAMLVNAIASSGAYET
jgi:DNA-binding transcriptional LysR family regulator